MYNVNRFKVCLNCNTCISIIPDTNFYEFEKLFDTKHRNHLTVIMTTKEMLIYAERQDVIKKIHKNNVALRNLQSYVGTPTEPEKKYLNELKNENKQLKKRLKRLNDQTISFNDVLQAQFKV